MQKIAPNLSVNERKVIEASVYPRIADLKLEQMKTPIYEAIGSAAMIKGTGKLTGKDLQEIGDYVAKTLKESFTTCRIGEVLQAIEMGARGDLFQENDMNVLSPENIFKWIHRFNEKVRREAIAKQKAHEDKLSKVIEDSEKEAKIKAFEEEIAQALLFTQEQLDNLPTGLKASYFRHLDSTGRVDMTMIQKLEIYAVCEKMVSVPKKSDLGKFADMVGEGKKREARIKELCQSMAFELIANN